MYGGPFGSYGGAPGLSEEERKELKEVAKEVLKEVLKALGMHSLFSLKKKCDSERTAECIELKDQENITTAQDTTGNSKTLGK